MVSSAIDTYLPFCVAGVVGWQPRALEITYNVLEVSSTTLTKDSKESFSHLVLRFLVDDLWLLKGSSLADVRTF